LRIFDHILKLSPDRLIGRDAETLARTPFGFPKHAFEAARKYLDDMITIGLAIGVTRNYIGLLQVFISRLVAANQIMVISTQHKDEYTELKYSLIFFISYSDCKNQQDNTVGRLLHRSSP
jgi:hypothetical protein